jgi:hypothetical protein
MKLGWQLINGTWHQVIIEQRYNHETHRDEPAEELLPERKVTQNDILEFGRWRYPGGKRFAGWTFVRYW